MTEQINETLEIAKTEGIVPAIVRLKQEGGPEAEQVAEGVVAKGIEEEMFSKESVRDAQRAAVLHRHDSPEVPTPPDENERTQELDENILISKAFQRAMRIQQVRTKHQKRR